MITDVLSAILELASYIKSRYSIQKVAIKYDFFNLTTASNKSIAKDDTMCIIPECIRPKYKDPSTGEEFDCCGKGHAAMAKARNIQRKVFIVTSLIQLFFKQNIDLWNISTNASDN